MRKKKGNMTRKESRLKDGFRFIHIRNIENSHNPSVQTPATHILLTFLREAFKIKTIAGTNNGTQDQYRPFR